jgi:hypothetical protein
VIKTLFYKSQRNFLEESSKNVLFLVQTDKRLALKNTLIWFSLEKTLLLLENCLKKPECGRSKRKRATIINPKRMPQSLWMSKFEINFMDQ